MAAEGPPAVIAESNFPPYAYGLLQAAALAKRLGVSALATAELGVATGNGLLELERLAGVLGAAHGLRIDTIGFDTGVGMPAPVDHRDMPYIWREGFFRMDEAALRSRLQRSTLLLGDVAETAPEVVAGDWPPIGFLAFDLDYYSATSAAMRALLLGPPERYLPRVFCYFDDTVGPHEEYHSPFTGELLAIDEFNAAHAMRKIARINGLRYKLLPLEAPWVEGIYVLHLFDHPRYADYVFPEVSRQFPLERQHRRPVQ